MAKLKYLNIVYRITPAMKEALNEVPRRGGMYNWMFLFKGSMMQMHDVTKKEIEKFDVVQINLSPVDQILLREAREMLGDNSSTIIIANNDYVCEAWDSWGQHPLEYLQTQKYADALFSTEPHQVSNMRDGAYVIPHPHWIKMLKHIGNDDLELDKFKVGALYHWWEGKSYIQSLVLEKLRKKYPKIITRLYGYNGANDKSARWQKVMFDVHENLMNYPNFIRSLQTNRFVYEGSSYHTYGRTTVDTAALGIPSVGTDRVFSMKHCFPNMCCDPFDGKTTLEIMEKIFRGGSWLDKQMDLAYENCEYFNYKNSENRYMKMVEDTRRMLKK